MKLGQSDLPRNIVVIGDVRKRLAELPAASVDCVITSPPYFQLRDYGMANQIGLEDSVEGWVNELRLVMRGVARVIKPTGSVWLNLGDTFSRHEKFGAAAKSLLLGPERIALGLIEDGYTIRSKIIWAKTNNPPNPVRDRLSCSWEIIYFLTRSGRYHFDLDAIRVPHTSAPTKHRPTTAPRVPPKGRPTWAGPLAGNNAGLARLKAQGLVGHPLGKNPGDVWHLSASNFRGQHFATFPPALVQRPLLATCPERVCRSCKRPWQRDQVRRIGHLAVRGELRPGCPCRKGWQPGVVLDPFFGAGTVGLVAEQLGREWLGIELNPAFAKLATERIEAARISADEGSDRRAA
jgi:site-specific DNA-methyltransferase (adenine-specific)